MVGLPQVNACNREIYSAACVGSRFAQSWPNRRQRAGHKPTRFNNTSHDLWSLSETLQVCAASINILQQDARNTVTSSVATLPASLLREFVEPPRRTRMTPVLITGILFFILFWSPLLTLARDWWYDPNAGHGLLLAPLALFFAWKRGIDPISRPRPWVGIVMLIAAVLVRYVSSLAVELFTMRASMLLAVSALVVYTFGFRQLRRWWLPFTLLLLSIPLPAVLIGTLALPLQFKASQMGAALLELRNVPVLLAGNVIHLPGRTLFVTEACSGLRSLTSLLALGVLIGGIWLRMPVLRVMLVLAAIPIAVFLNAVRIFLTGFLVYFVDPRLGDGLMHYTEGWVIFAVAFLILGGLAWLLTHAEQRWKPA
jgi:exosortase